MSREHDSGQGDCDGCEPLHNNPSRARTGNDGIGGPLTTLRRILLVAAGRKLRPEEFAEGQRATAEAERATAAAVDEARALVRVEVAEAQQQAAGAIREVGELKDELHRVKDAVLAALDHECEY